ncbi:hypothetical protein BH11BAC6_BH11BAC6_06280 [soil metagenome]
MNEASLRRTLVQLNAKQHDSCANLGYLNMKKHVEAHRMLTKESHVQVCDATNAQLKLPKPVSKEKTLLKLAHELQTTI